jgi:putative cardiolipin synthase
VYDSPTKVKPQAAEDGQRLLPEIKSAFDVAEQEVFVVSPYFVPGKEGVSFFRALRERGVQVSILTNSLASSDVSMVHAGYAKYRKPLLQAGINLYEVSPSADFRKKRKVEKKNDKSIFGSTRMSLHAKAFVIDRRKIFVGSLNLDPRSVRINTENGIIFDSPELSSLMAERIEELMQKHCFRIAMEDNGSLVWRGLDEGEEVRYDTEPHTGIWRRFGVWFLSLLPIESQL